MSTNDTVALHDEISAPRATSSRFGRVNANIITPDGAFRGTIGGLENPQEHRQGESVAQDADVPPSDHSQPDLASAFAPEGSYGGQEWTTAQTTALEAAFGRSGFHDVKDLLAQHRALHMSDGLIMLRTADGGEIAVFANGSMSVRGEIVHEGAAVEDAEMVAGLDLDAKSLDPEPDWVSDARREVAFSDDQIRMLAALGGRNIDNIDERDRELVARIARDLHAHRLSADGAVIIDLEPNADPGQPSDLEIPRSVAIAPDGTLIYGSVNPQQSNVSLDDIQGGDHSPEIGAMREHLEGMSPEIARGMAVDGPSTAAQPGIESDGLNATGTRQEYIGIIDLDGLDNSGIGGPLVCHADGFRDMSTGEEYALDHDECQELVQQYLGKLRLEDPEEFARVRQEQDDLRTGEERAPGLDRAPGHDAGGYDLSLNR